MNELSLFTGAGGGLLGSILLGWHPIGYVEWDDYCQRVIAARIKDGILPDAPIFGNIKTFISEGYAASYQGLVDVITSGFPCQPFSVAGKRKGADDERNMWPSTAECIGIVRPRFVLLENVPGIRTYLPVVVRDLRRLGYEVSRPLILGADDVGAPHRRKRVWIVASNAQDPINNRNGRRDNGDQDGCKCPLQTEGSDRHASDAPQRQDDGRNGRGMDGTAEGREGVNAAVGVGDQHSSDPLSLNGDDAGFCAGEVSQPQEAEICGGHVRHSNIPRTESIAPASGSWDSVGESDWGTPWPEVAARLCRMDDGVDK